MHDLCISFRHGVACEHQFCLNLDDTAAKAHIMFGIILDMRLYLVCMS